MPHRDPERHGLRVHGGAEAFVQDAPEAGFHQSAVVMHAGCSLWSRCRPAVGDGGGAPLRAGGGRRLPPSLAPEGQTDNHASAAAAAETSETLGAVGGHGLSTYRSPPCRVLLPVVRTDE
ncbi:hypothetical protein GCM10018980_35470 [Streptomyces capoamus]|uniref:Uncharacterized protein n=1 Tax=Streptomyces capoamus TaxID=68183 RepID=A0A919C5I6_9ACTN|nr:hypothetical protein GCM10010501_06070 [Streptomyces libani subsp. rufus]GHG52127.1 hypothetical protein GCM10018980_35470 [Streptomyces capoamus]